MTGITAQALALLLVQAHDRGERCPDNTKKAIEQIIHRKKSPVNKPVEDQKKA